ncbi:MAG: GTPase/DUF3482 domain-containing protein [Desulfobulbaceae bacterium]|jgi:GTPase Era involved in 16S rRNA processing|nr:GTPase/DUF3482 domain-containing protein [Desulfobulbaceae bacterium]
MPVLEIAVIGHPNEGKSSVLSTLAEDDSVRVSPYPGETTECRSFPVMIDGREMLRFTDTPGFQNPERLLYELKKLVGTDRNLARLLRERFAGDTALRDDLELLAPVARGAAILYVVDGSRPPRRVDRDEMEALRLTERPRMAVINCKDDDRRYLEDWRSEFRRNFNANRMFNAHRATYAERVALLDALQAIDQQWQPVIAQVVSAVKKDWQMRLDASAEIILSTLEEILAFRLSESRSDVRDEQAFQAGLREKYCSAVAEKEKKAQERLRDLFRHRRFRYRLEGHSILDEDLFSETTWSLLGLSRQQLTLLGALGGAALAMGLDLLVGGASLGLFTSVGGAVGAFGAWLGGDQLLKGVNIMGIPLGEELMQIGPNSNINLMFVLLNRMFLYVQETAHWAHGRRDYPEAVAVAQQAGFTGRWPAGRIKTCRTWFEAIIHDQTGEIARLRPEIREMIAASLQEISRFEGANEA